jgi:parvulin-like peptidyl-prolyl isomerase
MKSAICLILLLLPVLARSQDIGDDAVLATVGDERITVGEFRARLALGVFPYKDHERLAPVIRVQFLYSLIAERLLMAEAQRLGFDSEDRFRRNRRMAAEMFMRDRLYRDSVRRAVGVTEEEIRALYVEEQQMIQYDFLFSPQETEIRIFERLMQGGTSFDTLIAAQRQGSDREEAENPPSAEMDETFREHIDRLAPGAVSAPLRGEDGWYIVRKMDYGDPFRSEYELQKRWKRLENSLRAEKEAGETIAFVRRLWKGRTARFEEEFYRGVGQALLQDYRAQVAADTSELLMPTLRVFDSLRDAWAQRLEQPFLRIEESVLAVGDALDLLQKSDMRLAPAELSSLPELYTMRTREMADRFVVTEEAYRLGLDRHPDVLRDVGMWAANGLAEMIPELLWEQFIASDDSVWNYYISRPDLFGPPVEVKIVEVLKRDAEDVLEVIEAWRGGADLHELARDVSERPGAAERGGELGFFPVSEYGAIGRSAFGLRIADVTGPVRTSDGWSFFQLVDRRHPPSAIDGWKALRDSMEVLARPGLMRAKTDALLRRLAARGGISVDSELLNRLSVKPMQMFSIRTLGFGGRIPAVPGVAPLYDAVMEGMAERGDAVP